MGSTSHVCVASGCLDELEMLVLELVTVVEIHVLSRLLGVVDELVDHAVDALGMLGLGAALGLDVGDDKARRSSLM